MFKIDWPKHWNRLYVGRDRRTGDMFMFRKEENAFASLSAYVPVMLVEQETIGL